MMNLDGYADKPRTRRAQLERRIRQLKMQRWGDPGDRELLERIADLEDELAALDDHTDNGNAA